MTEKVINQKTYDIAIIGAGPAGSTFARLISEAKPNLSIALIDDRQPDWQKPCGGLLSSDAQKRLAEQKLTLPKSVMADPQIFAVRTIDLEQNLDCSYQRGYFNMDRSAFDEWLISLIPNQVSILRQRCKNIQDGEDGFILQLDSKDEIKSHYLIGADGAASMVRRTFFPNKKSNNYIAIQQQFKRKDLNRAEYYCVFDQVTSDSFSWFFNKNEYIVYGGAFPKQNSRACFEEQKNKFAEKMNYDLSDILKTEACQVVFPRKKKEIFFGSDNIFLIGEAAGLISASSFEGISYAIESGKKLATAFQNVNFEDPIKTENHLEFNAHHKVKNHPEQSLIKTYEKLMRKTKFKLKLKMYKRDILCSPFLRKIIMRSKVQALKFR